MISLILKLIQLLFLAGVILLGLKFAAPDVYNNILNKISEQTGIEANKIDTGLEKAKNIATKTAEAAVKTAKEATEEELSK